MVIYEYTVAHGRGMENEQPYFESGFPYGHDQWIASFGTAWAATALALSLDQNPPTATRQ